MKQKKKKKKTRRQHKNKDEHVDILLTFWMREEQYNTDITHIMVPCVTANKTKEMERDEHTHKNNTKLSEEILL